ncbi:NAD(P)-binding protein [Parathielavia appendiculata]|uniref:NAD(P)-binding protein n=1 Tax=Parathielavia appendiculata TaxID=2587402 RepID=A0AAN6Z1V5_9PEZI|nr:NAD(P)-binding protein [Parathielavia appendiculata]
MSPTSDKPPLNPQPVSFLGLGNMGLAVAERLLGTGHKITVWNRTPSKANSLVAKGATLAESPSACVVASPIVILFLLSDAATQEVLSTVQDFSEKTIINLTNGTPSQARNRAAYVAARGAHAYLHGAVMVPPMLVGQPESLTIYSGPRSAFESIVTVTAALGASTHVCEDAGMAALLDNALLSIMGGLFEGFVQSLALVGKAGVDEVEFTTGLAVPLLKGFAGWLPRISEQARSRQYRGGSTLLMQLEALDNIAETGRELGLERILLESLRSVISEAVIRGKGEENVAGLVGLLTDQ